MAKAGDGPSGAPGAPLGVRRRCRMQETARAIECLRQHSRGVRVRWVDVGERRIEANGGKAFVSGLPTGKELPALPSSGLKSAEDVKGLNVVAIIDLTGTALFAPSPNPAVYAYTRMIVQRKLFRIPLN